MVSKFIIGMTGAFGSGCTTIAKEFIVPQGFRYICLSDYLKKMCAEGKKYLILIGKCFKIMAMK